MLRELFQPLQVSGIELPNRIAMMAMGVFSPRMMNPDGSYTKDGADYYIERAKGGTGLIITGLIGVVGYTNRPHINRDPASYITNQRYLADGVHRYGAKLFVQLTAGVGRVGDQQKDPVAPSAIPNVWDPSIIHRPLRVEEIHDIVKAFGMGAKTVQSAGADGVEIHAVHEGYLLDQFATAYFNHRDDEYGGSLANRLRFASEIVREIKSVCGTDFPVIMRYSVRSYLKGYNRGALPGEIFDEKGRGLDESIMAARLLEEAGYDALDCDNGCYDSWFWCHPPTYMPKACNLADVKIIKDVVGVPVFCAGNFNDPVLAAECIRNGEIDVMGMGRQLLADPEAPNKFRADDLTDVRPCIKCHMGCFGRIFQTTEEGNDISCALNPACGREKQLALTKATQTKRVLVIGGGIAGMEAARVCALRGHQVELFEKTDRLGGAFIAASAPSFKEDDRQLLRWYEHQLRQLPISVHLNTAVTKEMVENGGYDHVFAATGAVERKLPDAYLKSPRVFYAKEALLAEEITGDNVLIVGGGLTGCELAYELSLRGKKVTIAEMTSSILNVRGLSAANYNMLMECIDHYQIRVLCNTKLQEYDGQIATLVETVLNTPNAAGRAKAKIACGPRGMEKKHQLPVDTIILSIGFISDRSLYESVQHEHVTLLGDAEHPSNVMNAVWQAYMAAREL